MNQKKNKGLLITIIVLLVLLILVATIACLYFFTDIFLTNKQAFFKYASQVIQKEDGFIDNNLEQYLEKKKSTNYENNGEISFEISIPGLEKKLELVNNFNIRYTGKTDPSNSKTDREITLNYSDDVNFPLTYRQTNDIIGIQTKYIGGRFVAINRSENENISGLKNIANFMNMQQSIEFSDEEIQNLKNTYFISILNSIDANKFSKVTDANSTGYRVTLTGDELKNILTQILETLKSDVNTMNKINVLVENIGVSIEVNTDLIDNIIESVNDLEINDSVELTVYENERELSKINMTIGSNTVSINKEGNDQEVTYSLEFESSDESVNISASAKYAGLNTDNVSENYEVSLGEPYEENAVSNTSSSNTQETQIEEKDEIQSLITAVKAKKIQNGEDSSQVTDTDIETELTSGENETYSDISLDKQSDTQYSIKFISTGDEFVIDNTGKIIEEPKNDSSEETSSDNTENDTMSYKYIITNNVQFKDSVEIEDLTDENSAILNEEDSDYVTNLINAIQERLTEVNRTQMEELGVSERENPIQYLLPSFMTAGTTNNTTTEIDETAVNSFNQKFELYESTNTKGATVKGLLTTIQNNNETEGNNKIEEINVDGEEYEVTEQNITLIKSNINVDDAYRVEFEKDIDTGLIYRAVINKR